MSKLPPNLTFPRTVQCTPGELLRAIVIDTIKGNNGEGSSHDFKTAAYEFFNTIQAHLLKDQPKEESLANFTPEQITALMIKAHNRIHAIAGNHDQITPIQEPHLVPPLVSLDIRNTDILATFKGDGKHFTVPFSPHAFKQPFTPQPKERLFDNLLPGFKYELFVRTYEVVCKKLPPKIPNQYLIKVLSVDTLLDRGVVTKYIQDGSDDIFITFIDVSTWETMRSEFVNIHPELLSDSKQKTDDTSKPEPKSDSNLVNPEHKSDPQQYIDPSSISNRVSPSEKNGHIDDSRRSILWTALTTSLQQDLVYGAIRWLLGDNQWEKTTGIKVTSVSLQSGTTAKVDYTTVTNRLQTNPENLTTEIPASAWNRALDDDFKDRLGIRAFYLKPRISTRVKRNRQPELTIERELR